jgi:hypothetical protein
MYCTGTEMKHLIARARNMLVGSAVGEIDFWIFWIFNFLQFAIDWKNNSKTTVT